MADEADLTAEREQYNYELSLKKSRKPEGPKPTGFCLFCEEPLPDGARWCDVDCARDYERLQRRI